MTKYGGAVAACGLAGGMDLPATVAPFILRGVALLGVDSSWRRSRCGSKPGAASPRDLDRDKLAAMTTTIPFDEVIEAGRRSSTARCAAGSWSRSGSGCIFPAARAPSAALRPASRALDQPALLAISPAAKSMKARTRADGEVRVGEQPQAGREVRVPAAVSRDEVGRGDRR